MPGSFFDTNVLIYLAAHDPVKADRVEQLIDAGGTINVQVLNEFTNVARRKMRLSWTELREFLSSIRGLLAIHPITVETHESGLALAERYDWSTFDAMIIAAALEASCDTLWSEDMQHGMVVDKRLRIANPFLDR